MRLPKTDTPDDVRQLVSAIERIEHACGRLPGSSTVIDLVRQIKLLD